MSTIPTRKDVAAQVAALIEGTCTREEASAWACKYLLDDALEIEDAAVRSVLTALGAADTFADMENYLYDVDDFRAWLEELSP